MHIYRTILQHGALMPQDYSHHATFAEAHAAARGYDKINDWPHVRIELVDVNVHSKAGVLSLLRGYSIQEGSVAGKDADVRILRAWDITPRGGSAELDADAMAELGRELYGDDGDVL